MLLGVATTQRIGGEWPPPPETLLRQFGASEERIRALAARPHIRSVPSVAPIHNAGVIALQTRREAFAMAELYDGIVLDLAVPWVVPETEPDLAIASQWIAFFEDDDGEVTSRGLAAFGLPELLWPSAQGHGVAATSVLTGLAHRLIREWPDRDPVGVITITSADITTGLGRSTGEADIDLVVGYDGSNLVVTVAPE